MAAPLEDKGHFFKAPNKEMGLKLFLNTAVKN